MQAFPRILGWLCCVAVLSAHDIITTKLTYNRDISPILAHRCLACHAAESSVALTSFGQVRPWAVSIKEQVLSRAMPPWGAVKGFGELAPDRALTQEEIMIIAGWVIGGAPEGKMPLRPRMTRPSAAETNADMTDAVTIATEGTLAHSLTVVGLRPVAKERVGSARIAAYLPDGQIRPLVWLYNFDPNLHGAFHFAEPIQLPAGTRVRSSAALRFALKVAGSAGTGNARQE